MNNYNLSLLPGNERRDIELQRQAALIIYNMRKGKINRGNVTDEINKLPESEQAKFKSFLNDYRAKK